MKYTNDYDYLKMLCRNILNGKFNYRKYSNNYYYGRHLMTQELYSSYGQIGYEVSVDGGFLVSYDWELNEIDIDEIPMNEFFAHFYDDVDDDTAIRLGQKTAQDTESGGE